MNEKDFPIPFDEVGNMIITKPKKSHLDSESEKELPKRENGINHTQGINSETSDSDSKLSEIESFACQFCGMKWSSHLSNVQHERWCDKNPNKRTYRKNNTPIKPKKQKVKQIKVKSEKEGIDYKELARKQKKLMTSQQEKFTIEELRKIDRTFGLTDEQIIDYVRGK